jgi:hypothetical protein
VVDAETVAPNGKAGRSETESTAKHHHPMTPTPTRPVLPERLEYNIVDWRTMPYLNEPLAAELVHRYNHYEQIKKQLSDLLAVLDAHETESFQCDRKEATYCDCLTRSKMAAKAALAAAESGKPI